MAQITFKLPERIVQWPKAVEKNVTAEDGMFAKIVVHPPLGRPTIVPAGEDTVNFKILLETDPSGSKDWEVALWHDLDADGQWRETALELSNGHQAFDFQPSTVGQPNRRTFNLSLKRPTRDVASHASFTVKFRPSQQHPWRWAHDELGRGDGVLLFQSAFENKPLHYYFDGISSDIKTEALAAETPNTQLWSLNAPVNAAKGHESGYSTHSLGLPTSYLRWFALVRLWSPWLAPRHGRDKFTCDKDAVLAAFLRKDGLHVVILAVSGVDDVLSLIKHDDDGKVLLHSRNDAESEGTSRILVAVADSFEVANCAVMYQARRIATSFSESGELMKGMEELEKADVKPEWLEEWADGFAFCTWNALGQNLTEDKVLEALESLKQADIDITNLIIDDNWQSLDNEGQNQIYRGMTHFEANKKGFPQGLYHTVNEIRSRYPNIKHIAVWHALLGYWGAISPNGQIAKDYKTVKVNGPDWLAIDPDDIMRWYENFYDFLSSCGIDSVKTDAQFMLDEMRSAIDRRRMIIPYQNAWTIANLRKFSARAISCMSQTPQMIFHSQLPTNRPKILLRNSDDFFPDVESSHAWHVFCNAHNALLNQHLNALPDWDMFQTSHPWAGFHAAARCVSGGPIYITDAPWQHDVGLIRQMTAKTPRGNTVILRPHRLGKSSHAYAGYEEEKLLKIETYVGAAQTGSSILGVFNVNQSPLTEILTLEDFPGTEEGEYVVLSHVTRRISPPTRRVDKGAVMIMELGMKGYDILTATPLQRFQLASGEVAVASLGLLGKMTGAAAVLGQDLYQEKDGRLRTYNSVKALGILGFYVSGLETRSIENDLMGLMFGRPIPPHCVKKSLDFENVLEIDLETAWAESDQKSSWSNEVSIELFFLR